MSDIETRILFETEHCKVETLLSGAVLSRPIRFKFGGVGHYLPIGDVERLVTELTHALNYARKAVAAESGKTGAFQAPHALQSEAQGPANPDDKPTT